MTLKAFACHSSHDSEYVLQTAAFLKRHLQIFVYEDHQKASAAFTETIDCEFNDADVFLIYLGDTFKSSPYLQQEVRAVEALKPRNLKLQIVIVLMHSEGAGLPTSFPALLSPFPQVNARAGSSGLIAPSECAREIVARLEEDGRRLTWQAQDDLPFNPHLFSYEKDIIRFFGRKIELRERLYEAAEGEEQTRRQEDRRKLEDGCPATWPSVVDLTRETFAPPGAQPYSIATDADVETEFGSCRPDDARVGAAALRGYSTHKYDMSLPEAGPRAKLLFPMGGKGRLRVAVLVSGGIAPGINAVIDGIVQRHWKYKRCHRYALSIFGYQNGFHGVLDGQHCLLFPDERSGYPAPRDNKLATSEFANQGGSVLGTYRMDDLIAPAKRLPKLRQIAGRLDGIDILYMIGGDGTMRAAHALWNVARERVHSEDRKFPLSVVAIPKTMDNDVLWVWQSFGFMSAVEKAREVIQHLHTEVSSNPRLCVLQLFGSDSGFVVSHAVLASAAGHCDLALIPEVPFSLLGVAEHIESVINQKPAPIPGGLVVMAETAVPLDAAWYLDPNNHPLPGVLTRPDRGAAEAICTSIKISTEERDEIVKFDAMRMRGERIQGQTSDVLRRAGLKIVMQGLEAALRNRGTVGNVQWDLLRMLANEPRHLLRAIPPSTADIVMGQGLGTLAVDNAMAVVHGLHDQTLAYGIRARAPQAGCPRSQENPRVGDFLEIGARQDRAARQSCLAVAMRLNNRLGSHSLHQTRLTNGDHLW